MVFIRRMIILFVFSLIKCLDLPAGIQKERYVLRENRAFEIDCIHNLEKVSRVKWEYISTYNTNDTIYDSQHPNKTFKSGFEVSCQPHETLISKCSLKLVQSRKEDSGKYICYVGQEVDAEFDSNALKPVTEIELVVRGPIHKTTTVNRGDPIVLPCEHNIKNLTRARWSHVSTKGVITYSLFHLPLNYTLNKNYKALCEPHELSCNLKILEANKESAGKYICLVGESQEFEEKYALDPMTYFIEIELVVGELECNENMKKDLTFLGENDCYGIEADVLNLKCSFNYFGNINYNLLHLRWIEKYKFNSLEKKLNSSPLNHEVKDETKKISIQTNLSVTYEMQNSIFQCVLDDIQVKPCQLHEFRTQYIKNTTERSPPIYSNDLHNIKCLAKKSANVQCSYYWVHQIAGAMVENPYAILPVENMNSPGIYTCIAKCQQGNNKECIIKVMEVEIIQGSKDELHSTTNVNIGLLVALVMLLLINLIVLSYFLIRKKQIIKRKIFGLPRPHENEGHDSSVPLNSEFFQGIITKWYDILIYEMMNYGKEVNVSSTTKSFKDPDEMLQLLLACHPNPQHLLIDENYDEDIVRKLKTFNEVKSIRFLCDETKNHYVTKIEIQENGLDETCTENIKDRSEYLKEHIDSFNIIIIKTYQESLDCADNVIVSDDILSYVNARMIEDLCKKRFPIVAHVVFLSQLSQNVVLDCLLCSQNPGIDFKSLISKGRLSEANITKEKQMLL